MGRKHVHYDILDTTHTVQTGNIPTRVFMTWCLLRSLTTEYELPRTTMILDMIEAYGPARDGARAKSLERIMIAEASKHAQQQGGVFGSGGSTEKAQEGQDGQEGSPKHKTSIFRRLGK
jgi:hypothetical protein